MIAIGRRSRTDPARAAIMIFTGWLLVTGLVFSFMAGIYHDYYTVALAPAIAGTIMVSAAELWRRRGALAQPDRAGRGDRCHHGLGRGAAGPGQRAVPEPSAADRGDRRTWP